MLNKKIKLSNDKKNIFRISFGTLLGQGISLITLPIFTRVYGAKVIGLLTLTNSIAIIVNSFSDFGLINAIMIEEDDEKMLQVYKVVSTLGLIFSILTGILIMIYYNINPNKNSINGTFLGIFIFIGIFTLQQIQICYTWLNRKGKYKVLMRNPIINNLSFGLVSIVLAILGVRVYGYFIGWIVGQIFTLFNMKRVIPRSTITLKISDYKEVFFRHNNFVKYQLPTNIITNIKNQLPTLFIKLLFGTAMLGYYSITVKILQIPGTLLGNAMGRVFFKKTSEMKRSGEKIGEFVYNSITKVMKIAIIPMILLISFGDIGIKFILGEEWKIAGELIRILAFQNFFLFLMQTVHGLSVTLNKQVYAMYSSVFQSIAITLSIIIGKYVYNDIFIAIGLMTITFIIINITYFCALFKVMDIEPKKYIYHVTYYMIIMITVPIILKLIFNKFIIGLF